MLNLDQLNQTGDLTGTFLCGRRREIVPQERLLVKAGEGELSETVCRAKGLRYLLERVGDGFKFSHICFLFPAGSL